MGLLNRLSLFGKKKTRVDEAEAKMALLRRCHFEIMEPRRVLSADPVIAGITYLEGDTGQDTTPDHFEVTFEGGADTTQLTRFTINGDQDSSGGLSDGDMFFDVDGSLPGTGGHHAFEFDAANSVGITAADIKGVTVGEDGLSLTVNVDNFEAGDVLAFTIDVDEVERFRVDKIASGVEFEGSFFQAQFVDENYTFEDKSVRTSATLENGFVQPQREGIFYDSYDQLFATGEDLVATNFGLSLDNQIGQADRTAGTVDAYELIPKPITISGTVYHDEDLDCFHDGNEDGIQSVTINLEKLNETTGEYEQVASTTTDQDGNYLFGEDLGLTPGTYRLVEIQPDGYLDVGASAGDIQGIGTGVVQDDANDQPNVIADINIPLGGTSATGYDFKEVRPASISGNVYHDANDNGVQDQGEEGIANVLIQVTRVSAKDGVTNDPFASADTIFVRTDANGHYSVDSLPPGIYEVVEINNYPAGADPLAAFIDGKDTAGNIRGTTVGINGSNDRHTQIELCADDHGVEYNFGELKPASLSGYVSVETPGSSKLDPTDPNFEPIEGVTIQLFDDAGNLVGTTLTDATGRYEFDGLSPGVYSIVQVQPDGYLDGGDVVGNVDGQNTGLTLSNDRFDGIVLGSGDEGTRYDFCEHIPASIKGTVYHDRNDNGVQDAGEEGIGGVLIQLFDDNGNVVQETRTDPNGDYCFEDLLAGEYKIRQTQPFTFVDGKESNGGQILSADGTTTQSGVVLSNDEFCEVIVAGGDEGSEFNFGEIRLASISGTVRADADGDKTNFDPSAGDQVLEGVQIVLFDSNNEIVAQTTTDANGEYSFDGLRPGEYTVRELTPDGYLDGADSAGTVDGIAVGNTNNDALTGIVLSSGSEAVNYDFCEIIPAEIHGSVYFDVNNDGVFADTERGIEGVLIQLFDQDGNLVSETTTMANGEYWFTDLVPGVYKIQETQPSTYVDGKDQLGTVEGTASGARANDMFTNVRVNGGQVGINYDFGEIRLAEISGQVHTDRNGNCTFDANNGEEVLAGVELELLNADGEVIGTTTTDVNGNYTFGDLLPGEYSIRQVQPDGYFTAGEVIGDGGGNVSENLLTGIVVESGQQLTQYNFCESEAAEIHGRVWQDGPAFETEDGNVPDGYRNLRDGIYQASEDTPIEGVRMMLYYYIDPVSEDISPRPVTLGEVMPEFYEHMGTNDPDAPVWVETMADGEYWFQGLQAGSYIVLQEQPANFVDANEIPGSTTGQTFNTTEELQEADGNLRTFSNNELMDSIVGIQVQSGGISVANNFTEVLAQAIPDNPDPELPPFNIPPDPVTPGQPVTPRPGLTGQPGLLGSRPSSFTALIGTSSALNTQGQMAGPAGEAYTWHLSVVNGGNPRSIVEAADGSNDVWLQASYLNSADWSRFNMTEAEWSFTTTDANGELKAIDRPTTFGMIEGIPLAGDFDGDGTDEVAVFKDGYWMIDINKNGRWDEADLLAKLGDEDDRPVVGDWDGDGKDDIGIYGPIWERDPEAIDREPGLPNPDNQPFTKPKNVPPVAEDSTNGARVMRLSSYGRQRADVIDHVFGTGEREDIPVTGDWNGNGIRSIGTFRDGVWQFDINGDGRFNHQDETAVFGRAGDVPLVGDFDGDGIEEIAVYRSGVFILDTNGNRELDATDKTFEMGIGKPVVGDWDGDGIDEPAVYQVRDTTEFQ